MHYIFISSDFLETLDWDQRNVLNKILYFINILFKIQTTQNKFRIISKFINCFFANQIYFSVTLFNSDTFNLIKHYLFIICFYSKRKKNYIDLFLYLFLLYYFIKKFKTEEAVCSQLKTKKIKAHYCKYLKAMEPTYFK